MGKTRVISGVNRYGCAWPPTTFERTSRRWGALDDSYSSVCATSANNTNVMIEREPDPHQTLGPWPEIKGIADFRGGTATGPRVAQFGRMSFSQVVDRARAHFTEMPGLELTLPEAVRLLGFGVDDCRFVIDALVDAGFLRWTARRTIVRTDSRWARDTEASYVSVRRATNRHRSVDRG